MRREQFEKAKKRFNETTMQRGYSIPFQVRQILQNKNNWYEGLTIKALCRLVKHAVIKNARNLKEKHRKVIQKKKVCEGTIYYALSQINRYSHPPFYIMSGIGVTEDGKKEWRYFVPKEEKDRDNELDKLENRGQNVLMRKNTIERFAETLEEQKEIEKLQIATQN